MSPTEHDNVLVWGSDIEQGTIDQAAMASRLPFVHGHVALMPDAHIGKGSTVGSVIPTLGAVIPAAIGVDIGCGMVAVETNLRSERLPDRMGKLLGDLSGVVPAGMGKGHDGQPETGSQRAAAWHEFTDPAGQPMPALEDAQMRTAFNQFGSLGGGNHFVEVCLDERDVVWLVLHSGSRGIGNQLAKVHIEGAKGLLGEHLAELEDPDLAHLAEGTLEFQAYISAMLWAQAYAMANRQQMVDAAVPVLLEACGGGAVVDTINCHHNFTQRERHGTDLLWITRKGAIRAATGMRGVIPGSMGTKSYIVTGLGNPLSYDSCSHGAGRRLSRGRASRELDVDAFRAQMAGKAWQDRDAVELLDEAPGAYKSIEQVMADQADLVSIDHELTQVLNLKGVKERRRRR